MRLDPDAGAKMTSRTASGIASVLNTHKRIIHLKIRNPYRYIPLALLVALPIGCKKAEDAPAETTPVTPAPTSGPRVGMGGPRGMAGSGVAPSTPGMPPRGMNAAGGPGMQRPMGAPGMRTIGGTPAPATAAGGVAVPGGTIIKVAGPSIRVPKDPFYPSWHVTPIPYIFDEVQPMRLASANVTLPPKKDTEVREVPTRRVSGIMSGDGIYAILEGGPDVEIVKPGSVTQDGYRVVSINSNSVKLQRREGNYLLTQIVPLTDIPATAQASYQGGMGRGGFGGGFGGNARGPGGRRDEGDK